MTSLHHPPPTWNFSVDLSVLVLSSVPKGENDDNETNDNNVIEMASLSVVCQTL